MSTDLSPPAAQRFPRYSLWGALVGAICLGLAGGSYGAVLHFYPEYKEAKIRGQLSRPHPDSERFVASVYSIRYLSLSQLVLRMAVPPLLCGALAGAYVGAIIAQIKWRKLLGVLPEKRPCSPTLIELLVATAVIFLLIALIQPKEGLVYYDGKDQFYWLNRLKRGEASDKGQAVKALCTLLEGHPFPCRSTIIPALATCGQDAEMAIPILERLATDREEAVREAADKALHKLKTGAF